MAMFMLNDKLSVCVEDVTEISLEGDYIHAWSGDRQVAIFKASEIVGCWTEREKVITDGKVY